jgi:hypothetical protein
MPLVKKENLCCSGAGCCSPADASKTAPATNPPDVAKVAREIMVDFLYLDLAVCTRCQGTGQVLDDAVADVEKILQAAGVAVTVNKVNVNTADLANQYQFVSSPTIRINGRDIDVNIKESLCESCGDLCGDNVDCRVWTYQGIEYNQPPKAMLINALLQAVYMPAAGNDPRSEAKPYQLPENLKRFYTAMNRRLG